jgi:hypothetical protein
MAASHRRTALPFRPWGKPSIGNPPIGNPSIGNPSIANPQSTIGN